MITRDYFSVAKPYKDFTTWFKFDAKTGAMSSYSKTGGADIHFPITSEEANMSEVLEAILSEEDQDILHDFQAFNKRPESKLYKVVTEFDNPEQMIDYYEQLLAASTMVIAEESGQDPDTTVDGIMKCLEWIRTTDFYTCPASTQYHDSFHSGLLLHTLKVVSKCRELLKADTFGLNVSLAKAVRACLMHDWCKIGLYESFTKNMKDESKDSWESVTAYKYKYNRSVCLGHGAASMFLASKFFKISYEEALAIRWHMGEYNVASSEISEFSQACRQYPLVYLLQFADRISCVDY